MARNSAYILITKNGPGREDQLQAIRKRVDRLDAVYMDDVSKGRRPDERRFRERRQLLAQLRGGVTVYVSSPGRLGYGRDDVRAVLHALNKAGCTVLDASSGLRLAWTEEVADALSFLDRAATEHQGDILRAARAARAAAGIPFGPGPKALAVSETAAEAAWRDTVRRTREEAAAFCGVSWRTLHKRFGGRTAPMGYRPSPVQQRRRVQ